MSNLNTPDRLLRALLGVVLLELAFFWLGGGWQAAAYAAGAIMLATSALRFCPLYRVFGLSTASGATNGSGKTLIAVGAILLLAVVFGGSYASVFFSRKIFLEDFNVMNNFYKQTLFLTGKNEREKAIANYDKLLPAYEVFQGKYMAYHPYALKRDGQLNSDLVRVAEMLQGVNGLVRTGDLHAAHLDLEKVRPVFQEMFKRNGFSMLSIALVDFHDAMELALDAANAKNASKVIELYTPISEKLKAVEAEANDAEIQTIRGHLDALLALANEAKSDQLAAKGEALKSSFVKVYLKRG
jgi:hypothetical protein